MSNLLSFKIWQREEKLGMYKYCAGWEVITSLRGKLKFLKMRV